MAWRSTGSPSGSQRSEGSVPFRTALRPHFPACFPPDWRSSVGRPLPSVPHLPPPPAQTLPYFSPEVALMCQVVTPASDMWSLGVVLSNLFADAPLVDPADCHDLFCQLEEVLEGEGWALPPSSRQGSAPSPSPPNGPCPPPPCPASAPK